MEADFGGEFVALPAGGLAVDEDAVAQRRLATHLDSQAPFGGLAVALVLVLAYLAFWRVGGSPGGAAPEVPAAETHERGRMPWVLIILYAAVAVYSVAYVVMKVLRPPTW